LQQLPLSEEQLLLNIISFNVGIELGQIIALTVMLLVLTGWRKSASFQPFSRVSNMFLIVAGFYLFTMQMHGYSHMINPDEFGFSADNHAHEHIRMEEVRSQQIREQSTHDSLE